MFNLSTMTGIRQALTALITNNGQGWDNEDYPGVTPVKSVPTKPEFDEAEHVRRKQRHRDRIRELDADDDGTRHDAPPMSERDSIASLEALLADPTERWRWPAEPEWYLQTLPFSA